MLKSRKILIPLTVLFVLAEAIFFVLIQMNIRGAHNYLCFFSVVTALAFSATVSSPRFDSVVTVIALVFTVCADYCLLLVRPEPRVVAMIFFNTVQLCYFLRLFAAAHSHRERTVHVTVRLAVIAVAIAVAYIILGGMVDTVSLISMIYFANLVTNIIFAFYHHDRYLLFAVGLLSFALCDVFVGLGVLVNDYLRLGRDTLLWKMTHSGVNFIWLFYVPSQTLIAISAGKRN